MIIADHLCSSSSALCNVEMYSCESVTSPLSSLLCLIIPLVLTQMTSILHVWVQWCHLCSDRDPPHLCLPELHPTTVTIETPAAAPAEPRTGVHAHARKQRSQHGEKTLITLVESIKRMFYLVILSSQNTG